MKNSWTGGEGATVDIPAAVVEDHPRFSYRGMHLDVSRHFFSVDEVKRYIDVMASYKLNQFHWHLTDDEGWRVEIKRWAVLIRFEMSIGLGKKASIPCALASSFSSSSTETPRTGTSLRFDCERI